MSAAETIIINSRLHLNHNHNMQELLSQLKTLRLSGMSRSLEAMATTRQQHELNLLDGLALLLQAEEEERDHKRFDRLIKNARFRYQASLEELHIDAARGIDKTLITELASNAYIRAGMPVLVEGATGTGKSFLISALGHQACAGGYKVAYYNLQKLLLRIKLTRLDGSIYKFLEKLSRTDLLILDDFGLAHLDQQQRLDLMEIIEDRHGKAATVIASQLPIGSWYEVIGDDVIADGILDRLVHGAYKITLKGDSLRKKR